MQERTGNLLILYYINRVLRSRLVIYISASEDSRHIIKVVGLARTTYCMAVNVSRLRGRKVLSAASSLSPISPLFQAATQLNWHAIGVDHHHHRPPTAATKKVRVRPRPFFNPLPAGWLAGAVSERIRPPHESANAAIYIHTHSSIFQTIHSISNSRGCHSLDHPSPPHTQVYRHNTVYHRLTLHSLLV